MVADADDVQLPTIRYLPAGTRVPGQSGFAWPGWPVSSKAQFSWLQSSF